MKKRVLLAVTIDDSLQFLAGYPEYLVSCGWDVHVVASPGPRLEKLRRVPGVTVHPLPMQRDPSIFRDAKALAKWFRVLAKVRPIVVTVGTPKASLLGMAAARVFRVPVRQYLVRGLRLETATGLLRRVLLAAERFTVRSSTDVVAISNSLRLEMARIGIARTSEVGLVGAGSSNGVDVGQFDRSRFSADQIRSLRDSLGVSSDPVIGFLGRITRDKGISELVEATARLRESGLTVRLLLVGDVDGKSGAAALERLQAGGVQYVLTGQVQDPAPYLAVMDVLCLPSYREGFGNAAIEASACGVPVVATSVTGLVDAVEDNVTGLLFPVGDVDTLVDHLRTVLEEPEVSIRLGRAGAVRARTLFSRSTVQRLHAARLDVLIEEANSVSEVRDG